MHARRIRVNGGPSVVWRVRDYDQAEVGRLYERGGISASEIGQRLGISATAVGNCVRRLGLIRHVAVIASGGKRAPRASNTCLRCGSAFKKNRGGQRYCSRACSDKVFSGPGHPRWKGGYERPDGYVQVMHGGKLRLKHRVLMEEHIGRPLTDEEVVHHRDGNPRNNAIENLELLPNQSAHARKHWMPL